MPTSGKPGHPHAYDNKPPEMLSAASTASSGTRQHLMFMGL